MLAFAAFFARSHSASMVVEMDFGIVSFAWVQVWGNRHTIY